LKPVTIHSLSRPISDRFKTSLEKIVNHRFQVIPVPIENNETIEILDLGADSKWLGVESTQFVMVRSVYKTIFEKIKNVYLAFQTGSRRRVLLTGTPGTGKTMFLSYLLYRLLKEDSTSRNRTFSIIVDTCNGCALIKPDNSIFISDINSGAFSKELSMKNTWYVKDIEDKVKPYEFKAFILFISSPNKEGIGSKFLKLNPLELYMPLWEWWELELARTIIFPHVPENVLHTLYDWFGGVVRSTLSNVQPPPPSSPPPLLLLLSISSSDEYYRHYIDSALSMFKDILATAQFDYIINLTGSKAIWYDKAKLIIDQVIHIVPDESLESILLQICSPNARNELLKQLGSALEVGKHFR